MRTKTSHLPIIYSDNNLVVINKPAGLICHPVGHYQGDTLISRAIFYFGKELRVVHRLDKKTSGVVILAKNQKVSQYLYDQFSQRLVKKEYIALVYGKVKEHSQTLEFPISEKRKVNSIIKIKMEIGEQGLASKTEYKVIATSKDFSLLKVTPQTGRRHQIRIHLAKLGHPIVGDELYNKAGIPFLWEYYLCRDYPWKHTIKGYGLHAYKIELKHPEKNENIVFKADIPRSWDMFTKGFEKFDLED